MKFKNQRGAAAVEFAIVLPILLLLFAGVTEFGIMYYNKQVLTNASREGARAGINSNCSDSNIDEVVRDYILGDNPPDKSKNRLITFGFNDFNSSYESRTNSQKTSYYCTVSVNFDYDFLIFSPIIKLFNINSFPKTINIKTSTTMKVL